MKRFKQWLRKWLGIEDYELASNAIHSSNKSYIESVHTKLDRRLAELDRLTKVDADVGVRGKNTIILTGVYRGKAYVEFYECSNDYFIDTVERLRHEGRSNLIRNIDAPPTFNGSFLL